MQRYRLVGPTADGLLVFRDTQYPSDAPGYLSELTAEDVRHMHSTLFSPSGRFFAVTERHAQVHGLIPTPSPDQE